jgi:hypothetical protein
LDHRAIHIEKQGPQGAHIFGNAKSSVGPPTGRHPGQQATHETPSPHRYFKCKQTPGLWKHTTGPITFTLVVDNFGVKYEHQEDINHLNACNKKKYELTIDWDGNLYCRI